MSVDLLLVVNVNREVSDEFRHLDSQICDFEKDSVKNFYENRVKLLEVECGLHKEIAAGRYYTDKQITASEIALTKEIIQSRFQSETTMAALSRQLEECCCDLKQMNIQSKLEDTQDELDALRLKASTAETIAAFRDKHYVDSFQRRSGDCWSGGNGNGNGKG